MTPNALHLLQNVRDGKGPFDDMVLSLPEQGQLWKEVGHLVEEINEPNGKWRNPTYRLVNEMESANG